MLALHTYQQHDALRPADKMSIASLLNDHDSQKVDSLSMLLRIEQKPLPPMIVLEDAEISDSLTRFNSHPYSYRQHTSSVSSVDTSSTSSGMSTAFRRGSAARAPRPKYSDDQGYFIWYHRTDLAEPWDKVLQEFALQFNHRRPKGGLQCKFYRLLGDWGVEKVREQARQSQSRSRDSVGRYGLVQRTNLRFDWMRPDHFVQSMLPQFASTHPHSPGASPCPGCDECIAARQYDSSKARL